MMLWIAEHTENDKVKIAAASRPKLQKKLKKPGIYKVKRIDTGAMNKEKICYLYSRKMKKVIENVMERMTLVVEEDGSVRKKRSGEE